MRRYRRGERQRRVQSEKEGAGEQTGEANERREGTILGEQEKCLLELAHV